MAKSIDFKEFLLQKGERLGFGIALVAMILLIGFGTASGVMSPSPTTTAEGIRAKAEGIESKINFGEAEDPPILHWIFTKVDPFTGKSINSEEYATNTKWFEPTGFDRDKKLNPQIAPPAEPYDVKVVRAPIRTHMISIQKDQVRIGWLVPLDKPKGGVQLTPQEQARLNFIAMRYAQMQAMGIRPGMGGMMPGGVAGVMGGGEGVPSQEYRLEYGVPDKPPAGAEPAEDVTPTRMVIVSAAFPYRTQLAYFTRDLNMKLQDLSKNNGEYLPKFQGFQVRRRETGPDGKAREWKDLDFNADYKPLLNIAVASEPETANMKKVVFPGLVMARPALARGQYPDPNLGLIEKALRVLNEKTGKNPEAKVLSPIEKQLAGETVDIFDGGILQPDQKTKMPDKRIKDGDGVAKEAEFIVPDYCLVRFIDVTVKPGFTYEYQMRIVVANPNFKKTDVAFPRLAEQKELYSPWGPEQPVTAALAAETYVYGVELDDRTLKARAQLDTKLLGDKDVTFLQVHRWIESTSVNPDQRGALRPVADWSIGDVAVRRGEMIGRIESVKVPMWFPHKKAFDIAVPIASNTKTGGILRPPPGPKGIPVSFATENMLVDWEGGKINQSFRGTGEKAPSRDAREDANVEYLIMTPDGKLHVRNSRADKGEPERKERYDDWERWVKQVEAGGGRAATGTGAKPKTSIFDKK